MRKNKVKTINAALEIANTLSKRLDRVCLDLSGADGKQLNALLECKEDMTDKRIAGKIDNIVNIGWNDDMYQWTCTDVRETIKACLDLAQALI